MLSDDKSVLLEMVSFDWDSSACSVPWIDFSATYEELVFLTVGTVKGVLDVEYDRKAFFSKPAQPL